VCVAVLLCDDLTRTDIWWNGSTEEQAMDRVHRIGQTKPVTIVRYMIVFLTTKMNKQLATTLIDILTLIHTAAHQ
jgi:hypothetical protein